MNALSGIEMISASAGTGKTYRLTELIVEAVKGGIPPERIMATTFTVNAAAELTSRVRLKLLAEVGLDEATRIEDAYIGTVHSLCNRFLSEYAIDSGISPAVDMLPEQDAQRLFVIAIDEAITKHQAGLEAAARRFCRTGGGSGFAKEADWQDDVKELVDQARINGFGANTLANQRDAALALWSRLSGQYHDQDDGSDPVHATGTTPEKLTATAKDVLQGLMAISEPTKGTQKATQSIREVCERYDAEGSIRWRDWLTLATMRGTKESAPLVESVNEPASRLFRTTAFAKDFTTLVSGVYACAAEALTLFSEYKRSRGLLDYVDLETSFLQLLQHNQAVRTGVKERVDLVLVDEFQDTSPIQLEIFLQINRIVGRSIWVGDPKQAIYGFRGTDSSLMNGVARHLDIRETLQHSWRSRETVIAFTNAVFRQTFCDQPAERVQLTIPDKRASEAAGGAVAAWYLDSRNNDDDALSLAAGVDDLLRQNSELSPGDIAILCRTNSTCERVAQALEARGVRTRVASGTLTGAREVQLTCAALRFLADSSDTIALAELVLLTPTKDGAAAPEDRLLASLLEHPEQTLEEWRQEAVPQAISELRARRTLLSPRGLLDAAISAARVMEAADRWSRPDRRRANIERLRGLVDEYEELRQTGDEPATLLDFVAYVEELECGQAEGDPSRGCVVSTYHGAKGLEWPVVILAELDKQYDSSLFGVATVGSGTFDPLDPPANRHLRYWPWPFSDQKRSTALNHLLDELVGDAPEHADVIATRRSEEQRLLYVGMTRARDQLILAIRNQSAKGFSTPAASWLRVLTDEQGIPLIKWPTELGAVSLPVGDQDVQIRITSIDPVPAQVADLTEDAAVVRPTLPPPRKDAQAVPRWITASGAAHNGARTYIPVELPRTGAGVTVGEPNHADHDAEAAEATDLGNAVHAVFGIAPTFRDRDPDMVLRRIGVLLDGWGISSVEASSLLSATRNFDSFLRERYGEIDEYREHPVTMRLPNHQELRGWIDLLISTAHGWVIIDHKAYAGPDPLGVATGYGAQLEWYRTAVVAATQQPVRECVIHFPLLGRMVAVEAER